MSHEFHLVFPRPFAVDYVADTTALTPLQHDQIEFKTRLSLISPGTELAFYTGSHTGLGDPNNTWAKFPFKPGYAAVGRVEAVGAQVSSLRADDTIYTIASHATRTRLKSASDQPRLPIPANCPEEHVVFTRLAGIAATAPAVTGVQAGESVLVLGAGLIGNLAAQLYALAGARVAVVDPVEARQRIARACGVAAFGDVEAALAWLETPYDLVVEATGVPALVAVALEAVRRRGQVVLLGSPRGSVEMDVYRHIHARGIRLSGAHEALQGVDGLPSRLELSRQVLDHIASNRLTIAPLITHILPAREAQTAYELLLHSKEQALGVLLQWS